jgi:hypothetical protein
MKKTIAIVLVIGSVLLLVLGIALSSPYYYYSKILNNDYRSEWFSLDLSNKLIFKPLSTLKLEQEDKNYNEDLWRQLHFKDVQFKLPVKDPFYLLAPILERSSANEYVFGLNFLTASNKNLTRLYLVEDFYFPNIFKEQKIFELPVVKGYIKQFSREKIWSDLFTKNIEGWNISFGDMIYNLYLLQLRIKLFPDNYINFGLSNDKTIAIVELRSEDKDYKVEYILTHKRNRIYAFLLFTNIHTLQATILRSHLLKDMQFEPSSESLQHIIIKEFESLPYAQKIDQEGMLTLFSAWTHGTKNKELLRLMIQYLERGKRNEAQLDPLYRYAKDHYGKTFSLGKRLDKMLSEEVKLLRKIEMEASRIEPEIPDLNDDPRPLTIEEKLEAAKRDKVKEADDEILMD